MVEYLYHGFLFISLILIFFGIRSYRITVDLLKNGILTLAKVVAIRTSYDEGTYYPPVFEYKDSNGTIIEFESEVGFSTTRWPKCSRVQLAPVSKLAAVKVVAILMGCGTCAIQNCYRDRRVGDVA